MQCPICHSNLENKNDYVSLCPKKHGAAVSSKDLLKLRKGELKVNIEDEYDHEHDKNRKIDCPKCGDLMHIVDFNSSGIMIDACVNCHTRWLDKGELNKVNDKYSGKKIYLTKEINLDRLKSEDIKILANMNYSLKQADVNKVNVDKKFNELMIVGRSRWQRVYTLKDKSNPGNTNMLGKIGDNPLAYILIAIVLTVLTAILLKLVFQALLSS